MPSRGIELGTFCSRERRLNRSATALFRVQCNNGNTNECRFRCHGYPPPNSEYLAINSAGNYEETIEAGKDQKAHFDIS